MRIALAQINPVIGDFSGNAKRILDFSRRAKELKADLVLFPEMALCGYPPMDLLDTPAFTDGNLLALRSLQKELPSGIAVVIGHVDRNPEASGNPWVNAASILLDGRVVFTQNKTLLPSYDVFDEARYFEPASERRLFPFGSERIGIAICEDLWWEREYLPGARYEIDPVKELLDQGASLILCPSASPFYAGKASIRLSLLERIGETAGVPVFYANLVGGNDSLVFDGRSLVTDARGDLVSLGKGFAEDLFVVDTAKMPDPMPLVEEKYADIENALVLGTKDYLAKTGFGSVHYGLSGGIDSAVTAVLAVRAVGAEQTKAFLLPSRYSSSGSVDDSVELCRRLGVGYHALPIEAPFADFLGLLGPVFGDRKPDSTEENLQARIRAVLLMAYSNKFRSLLLTTGNKSELAVGYCTLYGDMCGGLGLIGDLFKTEVYALARHINRNGEIIQASIIDKAPSAELKPDQTDQDSLPPYEILDGILSLHLLRNRSHEEIVEAGFDAATVARTLRMIGIAEFKRRQAPPVLKVSPRAFGMGRRMPIARHLYE